LITLVTGPSTGAKAQGEDLPQTCDKDRKVKEGPGQMRHKIQRSGCLGWDGKVGGGTVIKQRQNTNGDEQKIDTPERKSVTNERAIQEKTTS